LFIENKILILEEKRRLEENYLNISTYIAKNVLLKNYVLNCDSNT